MSSNIAITSSLYNILLSVFLLIIPQNKHSSGNDRTFLEEHPQFSGSGSS
jgi:hypothetical protein